MKVKTLGRWGENIALFYLKNKGYKLIRRNFHSHFGEIDLIMQDYETIVAVEVKTRTSSQYGHPLETITPKQIRSIKKTLAYFLLLNPNSPPNLRIDVISVLLDSYQLRPPAIEHIINITM